MRLLIRHVHFPATGDLERRALEEDLELHDTAVNYLDIGDSNSTPRQRHHACLLMPSVPTFRANSQGPFISTIDLQHRPVEVRIKTEPLASRSYKWECMAPNVGQQMWNAAAKDRLAILINENIDEAWEFWHTLAGESFAPSRAKRTCPYASGWSSGSRTDELQRLWKRCRQERACQTVDGDELAEQLQTCITKLIDDESSCRLAAWCKDMKNRGRAAKWVKAKAQILHEMQFSPDWDGELREQLAPLPPGLDDQAKATTAELATRCNTGAFKVNRDAPHQLSRIVDNFYESELVFEEPETIFNKPLPAYFTQEQFGTMKFEGGRISKWTPGHALRYAPAGAGSLDGWTGRLSRDTLLAS